MNDKETINQILQMKTIAVVGMSPKPERPSHYVALYLRDHGYKIFPVNPSQRKNFFAVLYERRVPVGQDI